MSNVDLSIGGRNYTVACAQGEEDHVAALGRLIDGKLADMPGGQAHGETRSLLFAALLLADQVHELEAENARLSAAPPRLLPLKRLGELAERLEQLAEAVETRS
ncbi:MAG: cell division protein ZapA [Sphingomonadales bacterium]|nr:cell division protein ZapA [Sphingomonadales bacterium]